MTARTPEERAREIVERMVGCSSLDAREEAAVQEIAALSADPVAEAAITRVVKAGDAAVAQFGRWWRDDTTQSTDTPHREIAELRDALAAYRQAREGRTG